MSLLGIPITSFLKLSIAKTGVAVLALGTLAEAPAEGRISLAARSSSQYVQNVRADADDLSRMRDAAMIKRFARAGLLNRVPVSTRHYYLHGIPPNYRYLRPWSKLFAERLSSQFHARFSERLRYTSLVRCTAYQRSLARRNGNAAAPAGSRRSSHLTGATLDISKRYMDERQIAWMRRVLGNLHERKVIYVVEEFRQPVFHVMVHRDYLNYVNSLRAAKR
jgi:hypothetical protein